MNRISCLYIFSLFVMCVFAQQPNYNKMSPLVREAATDIIQQRRQVPSIYPEQYQSTITAFAKFSGNADGLIKKYRCRQLAKVDNVYILSIPLNQLAGLSNEKNVLRIEAGNGNRIQMDTTAILLNALPVYSGQDLPQTYTGKGVVVGIQDIGFDLTHPTFYSTNMKDYRIKALWDQLSKDTIGSTLPVGCDYRDASNLLQIGHSLDGFTQTHGTHTAGIAAGSGSEGNNIVSPYRGIAYDADIVLVANATGNNIDLIDKKDYYKYTYATDALGFKYIFDYADTQGKPCVINFSEGGHQDFHGYDQLYYEMLDKMTGPGHIIVASAGNDADWINYVHKPKGIPNIESLLWGNRESAYFTTKTDKPFVFRMKVAANTSTAQIVEIPIEQVLACKDSLLIDSIKIGNQMYKWRILAYPSSYNSTDVIYDIRLESNPNLGYDIPVSIELASSEATIDLYRIRGFLPPRDQNPMLKMGDNSYSINSPSSAPSVISVGATAYRRGFLNYLGEWKEYDKGTDGRRTSFSGVGPTIDGRIKPDVMAPGQNIISAYSSYFIMNPKNAGAPLASDVRHFQYNGRTYAWNANGGTSMSSPVVAGAIALWLQAYPRLTPQDCLEVFRKTCTQYDTSLSYPNNWYGYGEINIYAGLKEVLRMAKAGIVQYENSQTCTDNKRIYYIDGRYAGTSESNLPRGIYVRNHQKFVKH
ncbi:S8 family serine peptidase [Prevotella pallens]|uniref:Serine protease AprX n=1 Tax=Prevotella pallens TaxID=60133 RepID=A0A379F252_9BACT|nr:S8 family serine peptidase [Prevotella pallens]SUC12726.1 Serine protease AprX [Prevotella pallens]